MKCKAKIVGYYNDEEVIEYSLTNNNNMEVCILNLGGIITKIFTEDKRGSFENVVLAYKNLEDYFKNKSYYGAVIGRTSGRIYKGDIELEGRQIKLANNYEVTNCHGGVEGFNKKIWDTDVLEKEDKIILTLEYTAKDGEEGYPGNLNLKVQYILNNNNELEFVVEGKSDKETLVNITNHSYFNLSGNYKEDILNHNLRVNADRYLTIEKTGDIDGNSVNVVNTPFDFKDKKKIGRDIDNEDSQIKLGKGYDHPLLFKDKIGYIELEDCNSGRKMTIETDNPAVVIYTMNYPEDKMLMFDVKPMERLGICFETQNPPIGKGKKFLEMSRLKQGEVYRRYTKYSFSTLK